jgi:hypothetical protein
MHAYNIIIGQYSALAVVLNWSKAQVFLPLQTSIFEVIIKITSLFVIQQNYGTIHQTYANTKCFLF